MTRDPKTTSPFNRDEAQAKIAELSTTDMFLAEYQAVSAEIGIYDEQTKLGHRSSACRNMSLHQATVG